MSEEGTVGDAVQTAVADGFSEMAGEDRRVVVKVGDGAGHAQATRRTRSQARADMSSFSNAFSDRVSLSLKFIICGKFFSLKVTA